jgi:hypothetical protein
MVDLARSCMHNFARSNRFLTLGGFGMLRAGFLSRAVNYWRRGVGFGTDSMARGLVHFATGCFLAVAGGLFTMMGASSMCF